MPLSSSSARARTSVSTSLEKEMTSSRRTAPLPLADVPAWPVGAGATTDDGTAAGGGGAGGATSPGEALRATRWRQGPARSRFLMEKEQVHLALLKTPSASSA